MLNTNLKIYRDAIEALVETLEDGYNGYYCDLHNRVYNEDYYVVYYNDARDVLNEYNTFDAIERVVEWEKWNLGEVDINDIISPVELVNMLYYVVGEEVISEMHNIPAFNDNWDNISDKETNMAIVSALREKYGDIL